jgi:hypothetical protein
VLPQGCQRGLASPLAARFGRQRMLLVTGTARACFPLGLAFTSGGLGGLAFFIVVHTALIVFMGACTPRSTRRTGSRGLPERRKRGRCPLSPTSRADRRVNP